MSHSIGDSRRTQRVASLIQAELSRLLLEEIADPDLAGTQILDIKLSKDLKHATVFYGKPQTIATPVKQKTGVMMRAWGRAVPFLKRKLADNLDLRFVPDFEFREDTHTETVRRVFDLLDATKETTTQE